MTQQGQGDVVGRSGEWTFTDCLKVAQAGYGEWALNPRNDSATEHLAGTVIISDMMACIAEAFRRALANAPLSSSRGEQGWRETLEWYAEQSRLSRLIHSEGDAGRHALAADGGKRARAVLDAPSVPGSVPTSAEPDEMQILADGVATEVAERNGCWVTCSGCYDTEDGHPTQHYPHSKIFGCDLGNGCSECGGLGVVWDDTDYEDMARYMLSEQSEAVPTSLAGQVPDAEALIVDAYKRGAKWASENGYDREYFHKAASDYADFTLSAAPQPTAGGDARPCTCHPDDNPPSPCPRKFALAECRADVRARIGEHPADVSLNASVDGETWLDPRSHELWRGGWNAAQDALSAERARVIDDAIVAIKKARRTKIVGPERLTRTEQRLWDKTRYDTFKEAEAALRALGQQDTGGVG